MILFFVNFFFSFGAAVLVAGWKTNSVQPQFLVVVVVKKKRFDMPVQRGGRQYYVV